MSTAVADVSMASISGSKSVPATPVSTPMTDQQPTGVMARITGFGKNMRPTVSNEPATGLLSWPSDVGVYAVDIGK